MSPRSEFMLLNYKEYKQSKVGARGIGLLQPYLAGYNVMMLNVVELLILKFAEYIV